MLPLLPTRLARMALFILNTGVRDDVVCSLQGDWEIRLKLDEIEVSVFEVPREHVKGRNKACDYVVCNSISQSVVDAMRGLHDQHVFVWRRERTSQKKLKRRETKAAMPYRPIEAMNNNGWQRARAKAGLGDLHVHDLRHTVDMRLREAGVPESTIADLLWHSTKTMTRHYSVAQIVELHGAGEDHQRRWPVEQEPGHTQAGTRGDAGGGHSPKVP